MPAQDTDRDRLDRLRERAEEILQAEQIPLDAIPLGDMQQALHDLQVYHVELELQNEELRRAQAELEAARDKYTHLYDSAPVGYFTLDEAGHVLEANLTGAAMLKAARDDLAGQPLFRFIAPEDQDTYYRYLRRLPEAEETQACEIRMVRGDGATFHAELEGVCIDAGNARQGSGAGRQCRLATRDVSRRVEAEAGLRRANQELQAALEGLRAAQHGLERRVEERTAELAQELAERRRAEAARQEDERTLHAILDSMTEALVVVDPQGNVLIQNHASLALHGHTSPDQALRPLAELNRLWEVFDLEGNPLPPEAWPIARALRGERFTDCAVYARRSDTSRAFVGSYSGAPVFGDDGQLLYAIITIRDVTQAKEIEAERERLLRQLQAERALLQAIIHNAPEGIVVADAGGRLLLANPAAERIYARPVPYQQPYDSHAALQICYPDGTPYDPRDLPLTRSALDGETCREVEMAILWPNGMRREMLVNTAAIRDEQSRISGAVGVFQDITERKQMEERLQAMRKVDAAILAASTAEEIAGVTLELLRKLVPCRFASAALFDFAANEARALATRPEGIPGLGRDTRLPLGPGLPVEDMRRGQVYVIEETGWEALPAPLKRALRAAGVRSAAALPLWAGEDLLGALNLGLAEAGTPTSEQMEIAREVADELAVGLQQARLLEQVRQHADELEALVGQRTEALRASEARFRAIFEQSALGISLVDAEGLILDSNPALQTMLGYTGDELRGLPFGRLSHPDDLAADLDRFQELVGGRREAYRLETRYLHREGEVLWANLVVSAVHGPKGDFRFAVRLAQDVTQQRRIQEALVRSEKLAVAGKLSASLMHEINNPLQAVIGCLALARESAAGPEGVGRYLEVADEELQRLAAIANQLRDLHRPHQPVGRTPTDVNALIERLLALHAPRYRECGVEVDWQPAAGRPAVPAAPGQLEQVFLNLLFNAVEAMPGGGWLQIRVEASDTPPGVRVHFLDSGPGIPGEILPHIFEPFYTTRDDGLGLGLFICHSIIQDHGGQIEVDSREGEGTTFRIWLPG